VAEVTGKSKRGLKGGKLKRKELFQGTKERTANCKKENRKKNPESKKTTCWRRKAKHLGANRKKKKKTNGAAKKKGRS